MNDQEYDYIKKAIKRLIGIDLDNYKKPQMQRRLGGLVSSNANNVALYCKLIERDESARTKLRKFLTINVSEFFRDAQQFDQLKKRVLPILLEKKQQLSVWSAGCSHGGEPYSIAMLLEDLAPNRNHRILATDIDQDILARAKNGGPYSSSDVSNVEPKLLLKYFNQTNDLWQIDSSIRAMVKYRELNLLEDISSLGAFDIVFCRNVLIYFDKDTKATVLRSINGLMPKDGVLFLGGAETVLGVSDDFKPVTGWRGAYRPAEQTSQ